MTGIGSSPIVSALPNSVTNAAFMVFGMMVISDGVCGCPAAAVQPAYPQILWAHTLLRRAFLSSHVRGACAKRAPGRGGPPVAERGDDVCPHALEGGTKFPGRRPA